WLCRLSQGTENTIRAVRIKHPMILVGFFILISIFLILFLALTIVLFLPKYQRHARQSNIKHPS
ncbi:MAG: hypothetical protein MUO88_00105, partial [Desulfobacterales bacterium]|nr:hypothetical protein [Desulfobacterales bacterium]